MSGLMMTSVSLLDPVAAAKALLETRKGSVADPEDWGEKRSASIQKATSDHNDRTAEALRRKLEG
ncbi:MAG: hypothetical protein AAFY60_16000, partial [Myxococcota bacterium]